MVQGCRLVLFTKYVKFRCECLKLTQILRDILKMFSFTIVLATVANNPSRSFLFIYIFSQGHAELSHIDREYSHMCF